jgi:hypothetical protein
MGYTNHPEIFVGDRLMTHNKLGDQVDTMSRPSCRCLFLCRSQKQEVEVLPEYSFELCLSSTLAIGRVTNFH